MSEKQFFVYILTNAFFGTFYVGVTSNLPKRIYEHRNKLIDGFSKRYNLTRLVYYEACPDAESAITREKTIKHWKREWKINIINQFNPEWDDLYKTICRQRVWP